jgi:ketosteroid isomerase-like protein
MSEQDNVRKVQDLYAAFHRGDIGTIVDNTTDDVTWGTETAVTEVPWYRIRTGPQGVGDFFATLAREVEFTKFDPNLFVGAGDDVLVNVDIGYRIRKNGQSASTTSVHHIKLRDGRIASFRAVEDTAQVRDAWLA